MKPFEIINYLQHLAEDFELNQRHSEAIYLREAAALVASHTTGELTKLTMTLGDRVFDMMTAKTWDEHFCPYIDCDIEPPHRHVEVKP